MSLESDLFVKLKPDYEKLRSFGFEEKDGVFTYKRVTMNGAFECVVRVKRDGTVFGDMIDTETEEEYLPLHLRIADNTYANLVRSAYLEVLEEIAAKCFLRTDFLYAQTERIAAFIKEEFGEEPDHPFEDFEGIVFRNKQSRKWYALVASVQKGKLDKTEDKTLTEVMNLKVPAEYMEELLEMKGIYPAYHMNKKSWITVEMNDSVADPVIEHLVERSRMFTVKEKSGTHDWLVPANPKIYDVIGNMTKYKVLEWPAKRGMSIGETVYIYYSAPYSAIVMKCTVVSSGMPEITTTLKFEKLYDPKKYPLSELKAHGLKTVRFAVRIPASLKEYLEEKEGKM